MAATPPVLRCSALAGRQAHVFRENVVPVVDMESQGEVFLSSVGNAVVPEHLRSQVLGEFNKGNTVREVRTGRDETCGKPRQ